MAISSITKLKIPPTPAENIYKAPVKFTTGFHKKRGNDYKNNMGSVFLTEALCSNI